jgi:hypothetical protein
MSLFLPFEQTLTPQEELKTSAKTTLVLGGVEALEGDGGSCRIGDLLRYRALGAREANEGWEA